MTDTYKMFVDERVSSAYTLENVSKYEKVLKELLHVSRQKLLKEINAWANKELNAGIPMWERRHSI